MEVLAGLLEFEFLANLLWLLVSVPILLALGVAIRVGSRRSRLAAGASGGEVEPGVSLIGRRVWFAALAVAGSMCLAALVISGAIGAADAHSGVAPWLVASLVLVLVADVAAGVLVFFLIALIRDIFTARRVAGRGVLGAYILTMGAYAGVLGLALVSGAYSGIVP